MLCQSARGRDRLALVREEHAFEAFDLPDQFEGVLARGPASDWCEWTASAI